MSKNTWKPGQIVTVAGKICRIKRRLPVGKGGHLGCLSGCAFAESPRWAGVCRNICHERWYDNLHSKLPVNCYFEEIQRKTKVELPQMPTITTNNAGKYYQSDGTFVNKRIKDSIGLCIISLSTGHVVMALEDCAGEYTHDEAMEEVKKHFNGKGEIPEVNEMLTAMISYKKALGLEPYVDYRAVCFGSLTANVHYTDNAYNHTTSLGYYVSAHIGSSWMSYCIRLRPIVRIK